MRRRSQRKRVLDAVIASKARSGDLISPETVGREAAQSPVFGFSIKDIIRLAIGEARRSLEERDESGERRYFPILTARGREWRPRSLMTLEEYENFVQFIDRPGLDARERAARRRTIVLTIFREEVRIRGRALTVRDIAPQVETALHWLEV